VDVGSDVVEFVQLFTVPLPDGFSGFLDVLPLQAVQAVIVDLPRKQN
jgi:hypothetical protein